MGHVSRHRNNGVPRKAARIALVAGLAFFVAAVCNFVYNAHERSLCFDENYDALSGESMPATHFKSDDCGPEVLRRDRMMGRDAVVAALAIVVVLGGAVRLSSASRHMRRRFLLGGVAVVVLAVYVVVLTLAFR